MGALRILRGRGAQSGLKHRRQADPDLVEPLHPVQRRILRVEGPRSRVVGTPRRRVRRWAGCKGSSRRQASGGGRAVATLQLAPERYREVARPGPQGIRLVTRTLRLPQGVYPRPRYHDRLVMRVRFRVRVLGSLRPEDCPTREHAPRGVREISSCRTASARRQTFRFVESMRSQARSDRH
jgi:hypothetical protein